MDLKRQFNGIKEEINSAIQDVLESQAFILGPQVKEFEGLFASYCNTNHAIGVSSGTDALILAGVPEPDSTSYYTKADHYVASSRAKHLLEVIQIA